MGMGATEYGGMDHVGQLDVVHVGTGAGDEPDVLAPPDGSADVGSRHRRQSVSEPPTSGAAWAMASMMGW